MSDHGHEVSASGAYMAAQSALPFANPGHLRGLTLQRYKNLVPVSDFSRGNTIICRDRLGTNIRTAF